MSTANNPDTLTTVSRNFYERARSKLAVTFVTIAAGLMMLAWCCSYGGQSINYSKTAEGYNDDHVKNYNKRISEGLAWSTFVFIMGSILLVAGGIYISPQVSGSNNEAKMLKSPEEISSEYSRHEA